MVNVEKNDFVEMNVIQRIVGVVFSPIKTMNNIANKPNFLVVMILSIILSVTFILISAGDYKEYSNEQLMKSFEMQEEKGITVTDEQKELTLNLNEKTSLLLPILTIITIPIFLLIIAGITIFVLKVILKGEGNFKQYFSVIAYSGVIGMIASIIKIVVYLILKNYETVLYLTTIRGMLPNNGENTFINTFATSIDVMAIWSYIIIGFGLKAVSKLSNLKIILYISITYALYLMLMAVSSLITSMFS